MSVRTLSLWVLRIGAGIVVAGWTVALVIGRLNDGGVTYLPAGLNAVWGLRGTIDGCEEAADGSRRLVFFGDSLAQPIDVSEMDGSTPLRMEADLASRLGKAGGVSVCNVTYSGLSIWSLYYMADRLVELRPEALVVEFNLFNFSAHWNRRDRRDLAVFLHPSRLPEVSLLPMGEVGLATDAWLFHWWIAAAGGFDTWMRLHHELGRIAGQYWRLADRVQSAFYGRDLDLHRKHTLAAMKSRIEPGRPRATSEQSRRLFGRTLTGVTDRSPALVMLDVVVRRFREAGIEVLVYIPPYNLDHLRETGVSDGSHFTRAVAVVERVTLEAGGSFLDLHDTLPDAYFRDAMDHLSETPQADGHGEVARRLGAALAEILPARAGKGPDAF